MYDDYPIEQVARSTRSAFQIGFARLTMHLMPRFDDVAFEPTASGLRILAASELALAIPAEIVRQIHEDDVELGAPRARLLYGEVVREPVMNVRASVSRSQGTAIAAALVERGARIDELEHAHARSVVRAHAPLRRLIGYPRLFATLTDGTADLRMWLSHYAEVRGDSPGAEGRTAPG
jgi:predicted membrane GTPase involved in stress response